GDVISAGTSELTGCPVDAKIFNHLLLPLCATRIEARPRCSRMTHSRFSTDPAEVSASRHPNARLSFRSRPETDRKAQLARRGDLPPSVQVQSCLQPRNGGG